jgi:signal transduction histidine kinase
VVIVALDRNRRVEHFVAAGADKELAQRAARLPVREGALAPVLDGQRVSAGLRDAAAGPALALLQAGRMLGVPIVIDGDTRGGLYVFDRQDDAPFDAEDEELAGLLADVAASVIRRKRLRQAAEQRHRWLTESAALTREMLAGAEVDPLRLVVTRVRDIADADLVAVLAERPDQHSYEMIEAAGPHAAALQGKAVSAGTTLAASIIADGMPRLVSELSSAGRATDLAELIGAESAILVPLSGAGVERGLLTMYRRPERPRFTAAEADAATLFAAQISLALELAEARARRERSALLDERSRIARDLHDHVIQRLFAIGLTLNGVSPQTDGAAAARLHDCIEGIDAAIGQIRSTIYRLAGPLVSAENSIRARAARLVEDMTPVLGFLAELDVRGPLDFGVEDDLTDDCIAVLREALTNAAKHAQASRVTVTITVNPHELTLEVTDDGCGIGAVSRRSGLANLRTRAERRRGRLIVASGPTRGTRLTWTVPLGNGTSPVRSAG